MTTERELKMTVEVDTVLPDLAGISRGVTTGPASSQEMVAEYYDTSTLALARWGVSLRWRDELPKPIWTVKLPASSDDSILSRHEVTFAGPRTKVPPRALELVRVFRRGEPLEQVADVRTVRVETALLEDGKAIATVCDDAVSGRRLGGAPVAFREIEVELAHGVDGDEVLRAISRRLRKAGCRMEEPVLSKVVRVLGADALQPADVVVGGVKAGAGVRDLVTSVLSGSLDQLMRRDPLVRSGDYPEDLHQFRVAARRLRSDLGTFAPLLDPIWARPLRDELRWIGTAAGVVRDADVLRHRLEGRFAAFSPADAEGSHELLGRLNQAHDRGRSRLLAAMSTDRYDLLIEALLSATSEPCFAPDDPKVGGRQAKQVVAGLLRKRWRRLKAAADALDADSPADDLHDVRILAKRCRYASEAAANVFGRDARRFAKALADVQEVLGDHQDTVVAETWLQTAAKAVPAAGVLAGLAIAAERADRLRCRNDFASMWATASAPELRAWLN